MQSTHPYLSKSSLTRFAVVKALRRMREPSFAFTSRQMDSRVRENDDRVISKIMRKAFCFHFLSKLLRKKHRSTSRPLRCWTLAISLLASVSAHATDMEVGAAIHFAYKNADIPMITQMAESAKLTSWRSSLVWAAIERKKGVYALPPPFARVVEQAREAKARGQHPLLLLGYGNPLYEEGGLVTTEEARRGFANYARWVATQMKGVVRHYEIWNEWNIGFGSTSRPRRIGNVEDYAALVRAAAAAIHQVDPDAIVIAGGATNEDSRWFEAFARTDALSAIDGVSIHPYNYGKPLWWHTPDASMAWVDEIENMMATASGHPVDMYVTEIGWPTSTGKYSEDTVADYLTRFMELAKASHYVRGVWWYDLVDDGGDPNNREHRFGLFRQNGEPKPAALRMAEFNR
jgi:polysaccharide biosynthesis protein PslG